MVGGGQNFSLLDPNQIEIFNAILLRIVHIFDVLT